MRNLPLHPTKILRVAHADEKTSVFPLVRISEVLGVDVSALTGRLLVDHDKVWPLILLVEPTDRHRMGAP